MQVHIVCADMAGHDGAPGPGAPIRAVYTAHEDAQTAKEEIERNHPAVAVHIVQRPLHGPAVGNAMRTRVWDAVHRITDAAQRADARAPPEAVADAVDEILAVTGVPDRVAETDA